MLAVEHRLEEVDRRLDAIEGLVHEVLDHGNAMDEQLNEKLDLLQDDFDSQRQMLLSLKKSLQCRLTRRRMLDWCLTVLCVILVCYLVYLTRVLR